MNKITHELLLIDDENEKVKTSLELLFEDYSMHLTELANNEYYFRCCDTIQSGIEILEKNRDNIRLVILDKVIGTDPENYSIDLSQSLMNFNRNFPEQKIIVLTNYLLPEDRLVSLKMGATWAFDKSEVFKIQPKKSKFSNGSEKDNARQTFAVFLNSIVNSQYNLQNQLLKERKVRELFRSSLSELGYSSRSQHIVEGLLNIFPYLHRATIKILLDDNSSLLRIAGAGEDIIINEKFSIDDNMLAWKVIESKEPEYIKDVFEWEKMGKPYLATNENTKSEFCVPLIRYGEVFAILNLESTGPYSFSRSDRQLILMLSNFASSFLSNAIFIKKLCDGINTVFENFKFDISLKNNFLSFYDRLPDRDPVLMSLVKHISQFVGSNIVSLFVPIRDVMYCIASQTFREDKLDEELSLKIRESEGSLIWEAFHKRSLVRLEYNKSAIYYAPPSGIQKFSLAFPIIINGTDSPDAIISVERNNADWTDFDFQLLEVFSKLILSYSSICNLEDLTQRSRQIAFGAGKAFLLAHDFFSQVNYSINDLNSLYDYQVNGHGARVEEICNNVIARLENLKKVYSDIKTVLVENEPVCQIMSNVLNDIIYQICSDCNYDHTIELRVSEEDIDKEILVDATSIKNIVAPLLSNCIKYGKEPYSVDLKFYNDKWEILISDSGPGIPNELQNQGFIMPKDKVITSILSAPSLSCRISQHFARELFLGDVTLIKSDTNGSVISISGLIK